MRKVFTLAAAGALLAGMAVAAAPASAACTDNSLNVCSGETTVAFTVEAGTIAIATTAAATNATQALSGTSGVITANLGLTSIVDTRLTSTGWSVSASAGTFTEVGATGTPATIAGTAASFYVPAAPIAVLGTHTFTVGATTTAAAVAGGTGLVSSSVSGANEATWIPYVKITLPTNTAAVAYSGVVTQSVA